MSGEPPRDAPLGKATGPASGPEGNRASQPARVSDGGAPAPEGGLLRPVPSVPRPSARKPTFPGTETAPKEQSPIPPPAKVPQVPGLDALLQQEASPPQVPEIDGRNAMLAPPPIAP